MKGSEGGLRTKKTFFSLQVLLRVGPRGLPGYARAGRQTDQFLAGNELKQLSCSEYSKVPPLFSSTECWFIIGPVKYCLEFRNSIAAALGGLGLAVGGYALVNHGMYNVCASPYYSLLLSPFLVDHLLCLASRWREDIELFCTVDWVESAML
jgi:hypothetical protein